VGEVAEPVARQEPVRSEYHGFVRDDPFHWMKDDNWQQVRLFHALQRSLCKLHAAPRIILPDVHLHPERERGKERDRDTEA
jgi:hypothetical protein